MARRAAAACLLACLCATADAFGFRVEVALGDERDAAACAEKAVEAEIWKEVGDIYLQNYEMIVSELKSTEAQLERERGANLRNTEALEDELAAAYATVERERLAHLDTIDAFPSDDAPDDDDAPYAYAAAERARLAKFLALAETLPYPHANVPETPAPTADAAPAPVATPAPTADVPTWDFPTTGPTPSRYATPYVDATPFATPDAAATDFPTASETCFYDYVAEPFGYRLDFRVCGDARGVFAAPFMAVSYFANTRDSSFDYFGDCVDTRHGTSEFMTPDACVAVARCSKADWHEIDDVDACP